MANLLSELLGLHTQIPICFDQHCGEVQREKIHIIDIIPTRSPKPGRITHGIDNPITLTTKRHTTRQCMKANLNSNLTEWESLNRSNNSLSLSFTPPKKTIILFQMCTKQHNLLITSLITVYWEYWEYADMWCSVGSHLLRVPDTSGLSDVSKVAGGRGEERRGGVFISKWKLLTTV